MEVTIDKCVLAGNDVSKATLDDGVCKATDGGDSWVVITALDRCGTSFNLDSASQGTSTRYLDQTNGIISGWLLKYIRNAANSGQWSRHVSVGLVFQYETEIDDISAERTVIGGNVSTGLNGNGALDFALTYDTKINEGKLLQYGYRVKLY